MRDNHFEGRDHGHGWESNKTLVSHRFIERDKAGKSWSTNFRGPKDRISLTQAGWDMQWSDVVLIARLMHHVCRGTGQKDIRSDKIL